MHARKRLFLACALGIALIPALPVAAQAPPLGVLTVRAVVDPAAGPPALVVLTVAEPSEIRLAIFAPSGGDPVFIEQITVERRYRFTWHGTDAWGNPVSPGTYRLQIDCSSGGSRVSKNVELEVVRKGGGGGGGGGARPDPPTDVGVVAAEANALSWTASVSKRVTGYRVYRAPASDGSFQLLGQGPATTFRDVPAGRAIYWYRVTAVDRKGRESVPTDPVSSDNVHMTEVVGPSGGTLAPTTGTVRLEIPAGAVPTETAFSIDQLAAPPAPSGKTVAVSRSFEIGPSGMTFAVPATLTLRLDAPANEPLPASHPADTTWVQYWTGSAWKSLRGGAVDTARSTVEVPIQHLSLFGATGITIPHGNYSVETSFCGYCHAVHNAPGPTLQAYPTERETCYQCHNSAQGTKVDEVQRVTFNGPWLTGDLFRLSLQDHETADIAFDADPVVTRSNIQTALLALPNIDDPPDDGVNVSGTGPFDVTFQNGQGNQDVPQMLGRSFTASTVAVTTATPGVGIWAGAVNDLLGTFGETWPVNDASTRSSSHPVAAPRDGFQVSCADCHTAHRDPLEFTKLLRRPDGSGGYVYSPVAGPAIGNQFCTLSCHDNTSPYPAPFGDHTAFTGTAHDTETATVPTVNEQQRLTVNATGGTFTLTFRAGTTAAQPYNVSAAALQTALEGLTGVGTGNVTVSGGPGGTNPLVITFIGALAAKDVSPVVASSALLTGGTATATIVTVQNGRAAQPSGDIRCLNCHDPHAGDARRLTDASQETLCLSCHTQAAPNTSGATGGSWPAGIAALFAGSNIVDAFATPNDYSTGDGNGIRIYHHPISDTDQPGGARSVECVSCHNSHLADRFDGPTTSKAANPANVLQKWLFGWDFTSGYLNRGGNVTEYCTTCHVSPGTTAPLSAGTNIPYDVRMVNDTSNDADGNTHDKFAASQWDTARHGDPTNDPASLDYRGCVNRGLSGAACVVTCTNCHDFHGSSNAYMLRETVVVPDAVTFTVTGASWRSQQGGFVTLDITPTNSIADGVEITVTGITPSAYNGTFTTTNSNVGSSITYAMAGDPGTYVGGGTVTPRTSRTITNYGGLDTPQDQNLIQRFCLTCHIERGTSHNSGKLCTQCHYHGSNRL